MSDCDGAGRCLTPTRFGWPPHNPVVGSGNWGGPVPVFLLNTTYGSKGEQIESQVLAGDVDGDGVTDLLRLDGTGTWKACLSRGSRLDCQD